MSDDTSPPRTRKPLSDEQWAAIQKLVRMRLVPNVEYGVGRMRGRTRPGEARAVDVTPSLDPLIRLADRYSRDGRGMVTGYYDSAGRHFWIHWAFPDPPAPPD